MDRYNYFIKYHVKSLFGNNSLVHDETLHSINKKEMIDTVERLRREFNAFDFEFYRYSDSGIKHFYLFE